MKEGVIMIYGPIGVFNMGSKVINGIKLLDVVTAAMSLGSDIETIRVKYDTPGGREDVGNEIYNYLLSLKPKYKIISEQVGMVGSIGTKPWFAGDERIATEGEEFFIHNPWVPQFSGDADAALALGSEMKETEERLASFYSEQTGVTLEGITPLMKAQTSFGAQKALELKFATKIQSAHKIAAYMKQESKNKLMKFFDSIIAYLNDEVLNMIAELEDGSKIAFATEDLSKLEGVAAFAVGADGAPSQEPAPDGTYKFKDGKVVTVQGGKVTKVEGVNSAPEPKPDATDEALATKLDALILSMKDTEANKKKVKDEILAEIDKRIVALKKEIRAPHVPLAYSPETETDLVAEYDRIWRANQFSKLKKEDPDKAKLLYYAKYKKELNF